MYGILVDVTRCSGCESCVGACIGENHLDARQAAKDRVTAQDGLSAQRFMSLVELDDNRFARKSCMHCLEPSCVSACLVGALQKQDDGSVTYDADKCIGCRYCMLACPFHVPRYDWQDTSPLVCKCEMCVSRLAQDRSPACVGACPHDALLFGERDELLAIAHKRISAEPHRYRNHVWGEHEYGGTCVLYVSDIDLAELDWPVSSTPPIPDLTSSLIESTPFLGLGVASTLLSVNWVIRRRQRLATERRQEEDSDD